MTISELKDQMTASYIMPMEKYKLQATVYEKLVKMAENYSGFYLSDEVLLSDLAAKLKEEYKLQYKIAGDESFVSYIKTCNKFLLHDFLSEEETKKLDLTADSLDELKTKLSVLDVYKKLRPEIVEKLYKEANNC